MTKEFGYPSKQGSLLHKMTKKYSPPLRHPTYSFFLSGPCRQTIFSPNFFFRNQLPAAILCPLFIFAMLTFDKKMFGIKVAEPPEG